MLVGLLPGGVGEWALMSAVQPQPVVGYTAGVFDLFHVGHLNLLRNARGLCDRLVVGVTTDDLVAYKGKQAVIPFEERAEIVRSVRYVDAVVPQDDLDKVSMWRRLRFDRIFVGDDWLGSPQWIAYEEAFAEVGVGVVYFPYTTGTSSSSIVQTVTARAAGALPVPAPGPDPRGTAPR